MNHGEWMIVLIVAIVMGARVCRDRFNGGRYRDRYDNGNNRQSFQNTPVDTGENDRLRAEIRALKDRIQVLERIATDSSTSLDREIESLRDRP